MHVRLWLLVRVLAKKVADTRLVEAGPGPATAIVAYASAASATVVSRRSLVMAEV
jgi:hypothetical protein